MKRILSLLLFLAVISGTCFSQSFPELRLNSSKSLLKNNEPVSAEVQRDAEYGKTFQLKTRKTVTSYFGAGYGFVIFTDKELNSLYPFLDTRNGTFLTNITLFYGFAIAKAVTLEFEPGILFTSSTKTVSTNTGRTHRTSNDTMAYSSNIGMFAIPLALNVRFFPFFKMSKSFARLFFIGGGAGAIWVKEDYDNYYTDDPNLYTGGFYGYGGISESSSQWAPLFKAMVGFTGTGGQFGFGGEIRYNIVPLKEEEGSPFRTRIASNFNSVDITLRFYFSL